MVHTQNTINVETAKRNKHTFATIHIQADFNN